MEWGGDKEASTSCENFEEFSQETREKIMKGDFILSDLSQNSKNILQSTSESPLVNMIMETPSESYNNSFGLFSKNAKIQGLKRRTKKINEFKKFGIDDLLNASGNVKDPLQIATKELDISKDTLTPQIMNESKEEDSFEKEDDDYNLTISQKLFDSQVVPYLRPRTEEEMKMRKENEEGRKSHNIEYPTDVFSDMPIIEEETVEDSIFEEMDSTDGNSKDVNVKSFEISIDEMRVSNYPSSDFCSHRGDHKIVWTKHEKTVPFNVKWDEFGQPSAKIVRVKISRYDEKVPREKAYNCPERDVKKCMHHTATEKRIPHEAFIYISKVPELIEFKTVVKCNPKGQYIELTCPAGVTSISFDLLFACRESCIELPLRRMKMCLVAILEDLNGNEISHSFIEEVRIVGYPRRDMHNYESGGQKVSPKTNMVRNDGLRGSPLLKTDSNQGLFGSMSWRKRGASEMCSVENNPPPKLDYQTRLLLGKSIDAAEKISDVEMEEQDENNGPKRLKIAPKRVKWLPFFEEDSEEICKVGLSMVKSKGYHFANPNSSNIFSPCLQSEIVKTTNIGAWLATMNLAHHVGLFHKKSIINISDLLSRFQCEKEIFERMGLPRKDCDTLNCAILFLYYQQRL